MNVLLLNADDDVAVCVDGAAEGDVVALPGRAPFKVLASIPPGHKIAVADVDRGAVVRKYGQPIGVATEAIRQGDHVHVHNLVSHRAGSGV